MELNHRGGSLGNKHAEQAESDSSDSLQNAAADSYRSALSLLSARGEEESADQECRPVAAAVAAGRSEENRRGASAAADWLADIFSAATAACRAASTFWASAAR